MQKEPIHQIFRAALHEWVEHRGRGAQAEISRKAEGELSPSQINDLLKGRRYGTEEQRRLISAIIGVNYEDFLERGRQILGLKTETVGERALPFQDQLANWPPHSLERAWHIIQVVGEETGWPEFSNWIRSLPEGKNPPGWEDYLSRKIDDYELYERTKKYALLMKESL